MLIKESIQKNYIDINNVNIETFINLNSVFKFIKSYGRKNNVTYKLENNNLLYSAEKKFHNGFIELLQSIVNNDYKLERDIIPYITTSMKGLKKEELIKYFYVELELVINLFYEKKIDKEQFINILFDLGFLKNKEILKEKWKNGISKEKNSNLLISNKHSYDFPKEYSRLKNIELKNIINKVKLPFIELPGNKEDGNLINFFKDLESFLNLIKLRKRNFFLRIKKIKKNGSEGMYIVNANTIIIDPRFPEAIYHEIGHYIYENKLSFTFKDKRIYANTFISKIKTFKRKNKYLKLHTKNELEKYSDDSEWFAYWFEELFKQRKIIY